MKGLLLFLYNILVLPLLIIAVNIAGLFHAKIRNGLHGRKWILPKLKSDLAALADRSRILIHVSSFGEWLQVRPVLNQIKQLNPDIALVVSFFSPSGFDHVSLEPPIDVKCYLPIDSYFRIKKFIKLIKPQVVAIVRHDIWPNFLYRVNREKIPILLIDASIPRRSWVVATLLRPFHRWMYGMFDLILAISGEEAEALRRIISDPTKIRITGDTKYDQVYQRSQQLDKIASLSRLLKPQQRPIWVIGSSWPADEHQIIPAFQQLHQQFPRFMMILVPHEPTPARIEQIEEQLRLAHLTWRRLSQLNHQPFDHDCLIVDQVGLLATIYALGQVAFVGGSFHFKIHNVLEPAVFGVAVLFGPKMKNSAEAIHLLANNAAFQVHSTAEIVATISRLLSNPELAREYGNRAKQIVMQNVGTSAKVANLLLAHLAQHHVK